MKNLKHFALSAVAALLATVSFQSCTDDNYSLSDLDSHIAVGSDQGLQLPANNSTKEIFLSDILDIDDSDVISTDADGNYIFSKAAGVGDVAPATPSIDVITIPQTTSSDYGVDVSGLQITVPTIPGQNLLTDAQLQAAIDAAVEAVWGELPATVQAAGTLSLFEYSVARPADVVDLQTVTTDTEGGHSTIVVSLALSPDLAAIVNKVSAITISLPTYLNIEAEATAGLGGATVTGSTIRLTDVPAAGTTLTLRIKGLTDFNAATTADDNYLVIDQTSIAIKGGVSLALELQKDADFNKQQFAAMLASAIRTGQLNNNFQIGGHTQINDIVISGATGRFKPAIDLADGIGEVAVTSLPDFLTGDEVRLVLDNPQITLTIDNDIEVTGLLQQLRINALDAQRQAITSVTLPDLTIKARQPGAASTATRILICDKPADIPAAQAATFDEIVTPVGATLASLIEKIPSYLTFDCTATADETQTGTVLLGHTYNIQPAYEFRAPLSFNYGSSVVYRDTISGWHEDLDDITLTQGSYVVVDADVVSQVPFDLLVDASAVELTGVETWRDMGSDMSVTVSNAIAAGTPEQPVTTHVTITARQGAANALSRIDGLMFRATAATPQSLQGITLNKDQHKLRIINLGARIVGRAVIDVDSDEE